MEKKSPDKVQSLSFIEVSKKIEWAGSKDEGARSWHTFSDDGDSGVVGNESCSYQSLAENFALGEKKVIDFSGSKVARYSPALSPRHIRICSILEDLGSSKGIQPGIPVDIPQQNELANLPANEVRKQEYESAFEKLWEQGVNILVTAVTNRIFYGAVLGIVLSFVPSIKELFTALDSPISVINIGLSKITMINPYIVNMMLGFNITDGILKIQDPNAPKNMKMG